MEIHQAREREREIDRERTANKFTDFHDFVLSPGCHLHVRAKAHTHADLITSVMGVRALISNGTNGLPKGPRGSK